MIDKLKPIQVSIKNFQSIENLDFEVSGFTCITGKTNIGKSAIIRSIAAAIKNDPITGMVRSGNKFCSVTLQSEDWDFRWEKGNGVLRYFIPSSNDKPLDKVGAGQIEPIADMGFKFVKLGDEKSYPWYADQFNPLFLLNESGSTVTDFVSEVSRLQVLQDAITISSRSRKRAADEAKVRKNDSESLQNKLMKISSLVELEKVAAELEEQTSSILEYERRISFAETVSKKLEIGNSTLKVTDPVEFLIVPVLSQVGIDLKKLALMTLKHKTLINSAQKVIVLKQLSAIKVPELPSEELTRLSKSKRFVGIPSLGKTLKNLNKVSAVQAPELSSLGSEVARLRTAMNFDSKLKRLAVGPLNLAVIPEKLPDFIPIIKANSYQKKLLNTKNELVTMESELSDLHNKLKLVQLEIDKIPNCTTCGHIVKSDIVHKHKRAKIAQVQ